MRKSILSLTLTILVLCFFASCVSTKKTAAPEVIEKESAYKTFTARYKGNYNGIPFKVQFRVKHDSVIWCSLSALSMEAGRMLITNDSLFVMDKINKQAYKFSKNEVASYVNEDLDNKSLEHIILDTIPLNKHLIFKTKPSIELKINKTYENDLRNFKIEALLSKSKYKLNLLQEGLEYDKTQQYPFNIPSSFKVN
jgi:hypothetical protein